jgi:hypothetical protein
MKEAMSVAGVVPEDWAVMATSKYPGHARKNARDTDEYKRDLKTRYRQDAEAEALADDGGSSRSSSASNKADRSGLTSRGMLGDEHDGEAGYSVEYEDVINATFDATKASRHEQGMKKITKD